MKGASFLIALLLLLPLCRAAADAADVCTTTALPFTIERRLENDFPGFEIQEARDLGAVAGARWQAGQPPVCPGMITGRFAAADPSYAFLLVSPVTGRIRLVLFITPESPPFVLARIDNDPDVSRYFITALPVAKLLGGATLKKLPPRAEDGIVLVTAGKNADQADVYFATGRGFQHAPVGH